MDWRGVRRRHRRARRRIAAARSRGRERRGGDGAGAALRSGSPLAEAAAEQLDPRADDRRLGGRAGSRLDHPPRRLARAGRSPRRRRTRRRRSAARPRRRFSSSTSGQSDPALGRTGPGLRLAGLQPRHHRRLQGQRLDRRQRSGPFDKLRAGAWRRGTRSRPFDRLRAGRGRRPEPSAGREPDRRHAVVQRQHGPEVHAGRKIPDADRQAAIEQRQQRRREPAPPGQDVCRQARPTSSTSRTATATTA